MHIVYIYIYIHNVYVQWMISSLKKKKRKRNQFMLPQIATVNDRIINSPSCQISRDQIDKKYLRWWILTKKWHPFKETILRPYTHKVSRISKSFSWTTTWELFPDSSLSLSNHNATRNKSDQRFIYNVETNFVKKKMLLIQMAAMLIM